LSLSISYCHSSSALQEHSHVKHRCPRCKIEFVDSQKLLLHITQKHPDRPHKCPQCNRSYAKKSSLVHHIKTYHDNPGAYICGVCETKFNRKDFLDKHMRRHSDVKEFKCESCEKSFKTKAGLSSHIHGVHRSDRQYVCDDCGFKTNWNSAVDEHKKLHTNELRKYQKYQRLRIKKREEN